MSDLTVDCLLEAAEKVYKLRCTLTFDYERTEKGFAPHCTLKSAAGELLFDRTEMSFAQLLIACANRLQSEARNREEAAQKALQEAKAAHERAKQFTTTIAETLGIERPAG